MSKIDIYDFIDKIQNLKYKNKAKPLLKNLILDLSKENHNNLIIEIINIEKINRSFFKMNKMNKMNKSEIYFCTICQENIKKGEHKTELCNCKHIFHKKCLNKYLKIQKTNFECPICRESYKKMLNKIVENKCEL
jgi:hypothetical protein